MTTNQLYSPTKTNNQGKRRNKCGLIHIDQTRDLLFTISLPAVNYTDQLFDRPPSVIQHASDDLKDQRIARLWIIDKEQPFDKGPSKLVDWLVSRFNFQEIDNPYFGHEIERTDTIVDMTGYDFARLATAGTAGMAGQTTPTVIASALSAESVGHRPTVNGHGTAPLANGHIAAETSEPHEPIATEEAHTDENKFALVEHYALDHPQCGMAEIAAYTVLARHAHFPKKTVSLSMVGLADILDCDRATATKAVSKLVELGLVKPTGKKTGRGAMIYELPHRYRKQKRAS